MLIKEFRISVPVSVDEYQVGQLYSVAMASKDETGGGDGVEVLKNEPIEHEEYGPCQYTHKVYHLASKVPGWIRVIAPSGSLTIHEEAWNAFPYCRTVLSNPDYMKDAFYIDVLTWHKPGKATEENVHGLNKADLAARTVENIDIVAPLANKKDYRAEYDPTKVRSEKTGRGPLALGWQETSEPVMTAYKLIRTNFKWFGLQSRVERFIVGAQRNLFHKFHRQLFCSLDQWVELSMPDIRALEAKIKAELDEKRQNAELCGTVGEK
eukprot:m.79938 g.79938  ORF g.79938 m.79938 type:complete len:266 (-) comp14645_c0_seq1:52-849(-)